MMKHLAAKEPIVSPQELVKKQKWYLKHNAK